MWRVRGRSRAWQSPGARYFTAARLCSPAGGPGDGGRQKLNEIVRREYAAAGVDPAQVETGAVIITGETAKKKNADEILRRCRAGGRVCGECGGTACGEPDLGARAGAEQYSRSHYTTVTNVDIGGGSANSVTSAAGTSWQRQP